MRIQKKMLVGITRFWTSCYFTGHAFELVFDILAHKILKITFFKFFFHLNKVLKSVLWLFVNDFNSKKLFWSCFQIEWISKIKQVSERFLKNVELFCDCQ